MLNEERDLLIKEVCARIPYNVKCKFENKVYDILGFAHGRVMLCLPFMSNTITTPIENIELYLLPLSTMTEEQMEELMSNGLFKYRDTIANISHFENIDGIIEEIYTYVDIESISYLIDYFYSQHLDFNGLIDKGIVKDATNLNIY